MRPKIGITIGDPGGIGPEVTLRALAGHRPFPDADFILFGSRRFIQSEIEHHNLHVPLPSFQDAPSGNPPPISLIDVSPGFELKHKGTSHPINGRLSFSCVETAVKMAQEKKIQAVVTAPVSKESWQMAGIPFPGHTAYLNQRYPHAIMAFFSPRLNVALFTHHLPLKAALKKVNRPELVSFFSELKKSTDEIGCFKFLLAGLNPHAGEKGMLGREEVEEIIPAMTSAKKMGMEISGPFPPDTVCRLALDQPHYMVISLYHDQGLAAFKLIAFNSGVNVTLGLPFVRTSPDHGTAFDIAGSGRADSGSMEEAIRLAADFSCRKSRGKENPG